MNTAVSVLLAGLLVAGAPHPAAASAATPAPSTPTAPSAPSVVDPAGGAGSTNLPVLGSTTITAGRVDGGTRLPVLVHGVRRVPSGTVLYYSVGLPAGGSVVGWAGLSRVSPTRRYTLVGGSLLGSQYLLDVRGRQVYSVLVDAQKRALASPNPAWTEARPGRFLVFYQVFAPLPPDLAAVDVQVGNGDVVPAVPVADGVLEPAVDQTGPLELGQGWPRVDLAAVATSFEPERAVTALRTETSDLDRTVVRRSSRRSVSVDLSSDVLFAVDSATLGRAAGAKLAAAAAEINATAAGGRIQIVGHTDNTGNPSYNQDLSLRRARAVAGRLRPLVTVAGVSFAEAGRGETEPVADNVTAAGRRENRRVSVVFTPKEGS